MVCAGDINTSISYAQLLSHLSSVAVLWAPIGIPMLLSLGFGQYCRSRARFWLPGVVPGRLHPAPHCRGEEVQESQVGRSAADAGGEGQGRRLGGRRATDHGGGPGGPGQAVGGRVEPRHGRHRGRELHVASTNLLVVRSKRWYSWIFYD